MTTLLAVILMLGAVSIFALILFQGLRGTVEFISVRNFFLLGLVVFQFTSAAVTLRFQQFVDAYVSNLAHVGLIYTLCLFLFTLVYLWAYSRGRLATRLARATPVGSAIPGPSSALTLAIAFLAVGMVLRLVLIYVPLLGKLTGIVGASIVSVAAGMAMWVYAPRLLNPIVGVVTGGVVLASMGVSIHRTFGRRDLLSVLLCCLWAAYHSHWKHFPPGRALLRLVGLGAAGMVILAAFSAVRSGGERERSVQDMVRLMAGAAIIEGTKDVLSGQLAGQNSMWVIENYPDRFHYRPLESFLFFATMPVPREYWPGKPSGLGLKMVDQAGAGENKETAFTLGPGMMGHIWHDNPWFSLVPYAVLLGLFCRYLDELTRVHTWNPFVVLPVGVALGQIVGLSRGELGLFLFQAVSGMILAYTGMFVVARTMALFGWRMRPEEGVALYDDDSDDGPDSGEQRDDGEAPEEPAPVPDAPPASETLEQAPAERQV